MTFNYEIPVPCTVAMLRIHSDCMLEDFYWDNWEMFLFMVNFVPALCTFSILAAVFWTSTGGVPLSRPL